MTPECKILFPELGEYRACFRATPDPDRRWICIQDELPPKNEEVLFCCRTEDYHPRIMRFTVTYFTGVRLGWFVGNWTMSPYAIAMETIPDDPRAWYPCTHWMPLPSTPRVLE